MNFLSKARGKYAITANDVVIEVQPFNDEPGNCDSPEKGCFGLRAMVGGKEVGSVSVYREGGRWFVFEVDVKKPYRRRGIATKLYDKAEEMVGRELLPQVLDSGVGDPEITVNAFLLWAKRRPYLVKDILEAVTDENREELQKALDARKAPGYS